MRFLRENVFYVSLIAGVLICVIALVVAGAGPRGNLGDQIGTRQETDRLLDQVRRAPNEEGLDRRKQWVRLIQAKAKDIQNRSSGWNRRNYQVLTLDLPGERMAAFPADEELRRKKAHVPNAFTRRYLTVHEEMVRSLRPATPARRDLIELQVKAMGDQLKAAAQPAAERPPLGPAGADLEAQARRQVEARAFLRAARSGWMYVADPNMTFPGPMANAEFDELWRGQVELWIKRDIFTAIGQTNESAVRKNGEPAGPERETIDESQMNVLTAPVKHLKSIQIDPFYCTGTAQQEAGLPRSRLGPMHFGPGAAGAGPTDVATLTQRITCREYDVIHYEFTVVMPMRYLPALLDHLMAQNYHTVRKVEAREAARSGQKTGEGNVVYYYGPEPAMEVTVHGEVLFLTSWSRPLMPQEVLADLQRRDAAALRPEDRKRVPSMP